MMLGKSSQRKAKEEASLLAEKISDTDFGKAKEQSVLANIRQWPTSDRPDVRDAYEQEIVDNLKSSGWDARFDHFSDDDRLIVRNPIYRQSVDDESDEGNIAPIVIFFAIAALLGACILIGLIGSAIAG